MIGIVLLPDPLHFQVQVQTLHDCVIPTIAFAAHAAHKAMLVEQRLVFSAGVLCASVGMHEKLISGSLTKCDLSKQKSFSLMT